MRMLLSAALAAAVFASSALAADIAKPLAPGKPAGVKEAQGQEVNPVVYLGIAAVVGVIAVAASKSSHNNNGGSSATTTTTTSTSP